MFDKLAPLLASLLVALVALLVQRVRARLARERRREEVPDGRSSAPLLAAARKVLVVDDERAIAMGMRRLLLQDLPGLEVEVAQSGAEALAVFDGHELLVVDVGMPGMSGPELVRRLLEAKHRFRVVVISGRAAGELAAIAERIAELGVEVRFLVKPFEATELAAVVRELLLL